MPSLYRGLLAASAALLLAGCAHSLPRTPVARTPVPPATDGDWRDFPVDRTPRPIVLLGPVAKHAGYTSDEAKVAAVSGNLRLDTPLPAFLPGPRPVALPDGTRELPLIGAQDAFAELCAHPDVKTVEQTTPLRITRVELGSTTFATDRGQVELPAWLFHPVDALGPIAWPAVGPEVFWRAGAVPPTTLGHAALDPDGRTVTVELPAPGPPCPGEPITRSEPVTTSTRETVTIALRTVPTGAVAHAEKGECISDMMLRTARYPVTLDAPLGNRVLLGEQGGVYAVQVKR
ncbi:hypothetical protein [Planosporangium mesophilum]|uniref:Uncharacterized protein n=1 Tax=Planosporangium mesophilum TaxID=689768 RepID=A0A8J3TCS1_9ACTN|nr:hypothetical protein [Planosporangium mesophilum]NJC85208.1 hypothetical protein [Planosporangium mesophilum]GII24353.1 hypothetical protein Pme01_39500 [Planosporangium mesophilum]